MADKSEIEEIKVMQIKTFMDKVYDFEEFHLIYDCHNASTVNTKSQQIVSTLGIR